MSRAPKCAKKGCRRVARQAFDVRNAWKRTTMANGGYVDLRHYEVCDKHADEFFEPDRMGKPNARGKVGSFVDVKRSERIKAQLVSS